MIDYGLLMFNGTFNNISVTLWRSVVLVAENSISGENYRHEKLYKRISQMTMDLLLFTSIFYFHCQDFYRT